MYRRVHEDFEPPSNAGIPSAVGFTTASEALFMPLPSFNENGDLPLGIHRVTLAETLKHFGTGSRQRQIVATRLERIHRLALPTGHVSRFVVFGSFITTREELNDVEDWQIKRDGGQRGIVEIIGESA